MSCPFTQALFKQHKFYIPDGVQPGKLIKSIMKELKKDEVSYIAHYRLNRYFKMRLVGCR